MKNYLVMLLTLFSLVYNQMLFASSGIQKIKPLGEMVAGYSKMRTNPAMVTDILDDNGKKIYLEILNKASIHELPEMTKTESGAYQILVGSDKVIFDETNWKKRKFVINNLRVDFSKVSDVGQLLETVLKTLPNKPKSSDVFKTIRNVFIQDTYAFEWGLNKETGLIAAAVVAAIKIGYFIYKNNTVSGTDPVTISMNGVDKSKYTYHGQIVSGEQFDVVVKKNHSCAVG